MLKTKFWLGLLLLAATQLMAEGNLRKAAIIVDNRAGKEFNDKVTVLEDLITSRIAGEGFSVLSREVVTRALKEYPAAGVKATPDDAPGKSLDPLLENSTSALRLAQNLGADFIIAAAITAFDKEKRTYTGEGVTTINHLYTLRVSYKLVEAGAGGAIKGATVTATKTIRDSAGLQVESSEVINGLLDEAAVQLAEIVAKASKSLPVVTQASKVSFSIACTMTDLKQLPITVPDLQVTNGQVARGAKDLEVQPLDVTVELDGLAIGSAPGSFEAAPGLHKLRLSREGFSDWERTINVSPGFKLRVALQMSELGYQRWKDSLGFLNDLENTRKLTDAEVKRIEGIAKFFSESHYRVDTAENIKIYKSLY